jgi:hypothetical protein
MKPSRKAASIAGPIFRRSWKLIKLSKKHARVTVKMSRTKYKLALTGAVHF